MKMTASVREKNQNIRNVQIKAHKRLKTSSFFLTGQYNKQILGDSLYSNSKLTNRHLIYKKTMREMKRLSFRLTLPLFRVYSLPKTL